MAPATTVNRAPATVLVLFNSKTEQKKLTTTGIECESQESLFFIWTQKDTDDPRCLVIRFVSYHAAAVCRGQMNLGHGQTGCLHRKICTG